MPHVKSHWRRNWKRLSKFLCLVRLHWWIWSDVTLKPIKCLECSRKTKYYDERADL